MTVLKSIVVCLALANAVYFLWAHGIAASKEAPIAVAPSAATLKLVGEAPSAQAAPALPLPETTSRIRGCSPM